MEAAEETLTYRDDTGLHRKLLDNKDTGDRGKEDLHRTDTHSDESNYVDLDMKPDGPKTVKVTFTGEGNQLSVIKCDKTGEHGSSDEERGDVELVVEEEKKEEEEGEEEDMVVPVDPLVETELPQPDQDLEAGHQVQVEAARSDCSENVCSESEELQYTDMYLNSKTESDDAASAVLSDQCGSDTVEDESHYITTHEIQLTELDHDVDYDLGRAGTCWEFEDDNLVYSFVDYASFESDESQETGTLILEGRSQAKSQPNRVPTEQEESDLCASSDESVCKVTSQDPAAGKIHLSIKTTSRAVNEPSFDSSTCGFTGRMGDDSHYSSFVSPAGARSGPQYFIPAPGRQHLATKLRRKDINEYSSGASSSISELDDADKEVRNLTAKSFRSLACPYFDAINLSTSSESSVSEYGLNKWSAYVDWNYGNLSRGRERSVIAHKTSSATLEMKNKTMDGKRHGKAATAPQTKMYAINKRTTSQQASMTSQKIQLGDPGQPAAARGVTLNFRCNVQSKEGSRGPRGSNKTRFGEVTGTVLARSGCEMQYHHHTDSMGDTHKRAIFASSLLKNVISKKMQFEQERKMERGEICDTYPAGSPCFLVKEQGKGLQRQISETGSGFTVNSADDQGGRPGSRNSAEEMKANRAAEESEKGQDEPPRALLIHSQCSAFDLLKEEKEAKPASVGDTQPAAKEGLDANSMLTKLLFVPSCQLVSKEKDFTEDFTPASSEQCEKELKTNSENIVGKEGKEKGGKPPEIKIRLRSVKENKGCTLNIANLLTPKISYNVNAFRTPDETKCHILTAADRVPSFTVRDIRETKCKFQTPIYNVRDVRKLVKSSYRFVSLDNIESKCSAAAAEKLEEKGKMEPVKHTLPAPIVIKCNSVKTKTNLPSSVAAQKQVEAGTPSETPQSENPPSQCTTSRVQAIAAKLGQAEQSESQTNLETKAAKQRQEKFTGEIAERKNESTIPKQHALEKLKAAVKTMEQLYVFDRNEWKRKTQAPHPITGSHVLSLIAREEQGAEELETTNTDRIPQPATNTSETGRPQTDKRTMNIIHVPYSSDTFKTQPQPGKTFTNKSILHFGNKARVSLSSDSSSVPQGCAMQTSSTMKSSKTPTTPLSVKIEPPKHSQVEQGKVKINPTVTQTCLDSENYLTIPGMGYKNEIKLLNREPASKEGTSNVSRDNAGDSKAVEQKISPVTVEYPSATIYHHPAGPPKQQHVLCFSPSVPTVSPTPTAGETVPQTQRKMLLDPTTGHYYLVDTPIQPTTKRLFDPETGQYVDVPISHSPVAPVTPVTPIAPITPITPVPISLSPLAVSTGAFAPTYMIYPGFIPSPTLAAQAVLPQSPCHLEEVGGETAKMARSPRVESITAGGESAYYSTRGETSQAPLQLPVSLSHVAARGGMVGSERKPVISITTQQGPRIIAPPSFDGTTMSFVVEHR